MSFPPIRTTIVCDTIHDEGNGKISILGFYGVSPDTEITVQDSHQPINQLGFLVIAGLAEASGVHRVRIELLGPRDEKLLTVPEAEYVAHAGKRIHLGVLGNAIVLVGDGIYRLSLTINGVKQADQTFTVKQGPLPS
jgi:hypothetical protein